MTRICFLDLETTSLRLDRRAWEIGVVVRDPGVDDVEHRWFIDIDDLDLGNADSASLKIGRFHERHSEMRTPMDLSADWAGEELALLRVEELTRGATVVGIQVDFDTATLDARMRANGICPSWSHRILDARTLAAGAMRATPPWDVEAIYEFFGVSCPPEDRHTALGDARLARDLFDAVLGGPVRESEGGTYCRACDDVFGPLHACFEDDEPDRMAKHPFEDAVLHEKDKALLYQGGAREPGTVSGCACVDGLASVDEQKLADWERDLLEAEERQRRIGGHVGIPITGGDS